MNLVVPPSRQVLPGIRRRRPLPPLDPWLPVLAIFLVGLLARLIGLGGKPYWMDEITTLRRSSLDPAALLRDSLSFHHLPLYFVVSSWFVPWGLTEGVMRLPAALAGAACCVVLFGLGRDLGGWRAGLAAGLLIAFSPFQVQYGQEARSYTLVTCFILLGLWGLVRLAADPVAAGHPLRDPPDRRMQQNWLLYGLGTALALDTLSVSLLWLLAANLSAPLVALRAGQSRGGFIRNWILVQLLVLGCYLPFLVAMTVLTRGDMGSGLNWVPPLTTRTAWIAIQSVYLQRISSLIDFRIIPSRLDRFGIGWPGVLVALLGLTGLWASLRRGPVGAVLAIALLTLPVGLAAVSTVSSVWMPRYLLWSGPVFLLLAGVGVSRLSSRWQDPVLAALAAISILNLLPYYRAETKPLWNRAAFILQADRKPGDLVVTDDPGTVNMMNVYLARTGHALARSDWTTSPAEAERRHRAGATVFAVHGHVGQNDPYRLPDLLARLHPLGAPSTRRIGRDIVLLTYPP